MPDDVQELSEHRFKRAARERRGQRAHAGEDSLLWLVEQGVKIIGIDAYTLDRPFANMVADYRRTGDRRFIWPAHFAGITREHCQIEKLANLDLLPRPFDFYVSCLPVKIKGASAAWRRAVALVSV